MRVRRVRLARALGAAALLLCLADPICAQQPSEPPPEEEATEGAPMPPAAQPAATPTDVEADVLGEAPPPGWFLPVGLNLGASIALDPVCAGFILGGELSVVYLEGTSWFGFYLDGLYDFGLESTRASAGIEAGWFALGLEAGYVMEVAGGEVFHGLRLGGLLTSGLMTGYMRWARISRPEESFGESAENLFEVGVLLKWPFKLTE